VDLEAGRIAELAGRPIGALTRRDIAFGLLSVEPADAIGSLPVLRRRLLAAGNPLSAAFWESAERILGAIRDGTARGGDVREWLEATGTEPSGMIGLHVWDEPPERSPLQAEMHAMLVGHLEERLAAGVIDPDRLVTGDTSALQAHAELQERWMTAPLPDGRVPMDALLDEKDAEFLAGWAAADAGALSALAAVLDEVGERPMPAGDLAEACRAARTEIARQGLTGRLLSTCGGAGERGLPDSDAELWLTLAAGVVSPAGEAVERPAPGEGPGDVAVLRPGPGGPGPAAGPEADENAADEVPGDDPDVGLDEVARAMAALCALEHVDWLAAVSALARGGPGTPASAADMARYVREYWETAAPNGPGTDVAGLGVAPDGQGEDDVGDEDFDEPAVAGLFSYVASLWHVLGATDAAGRLTPLGWWGLPEALGRVWAAPG
jgi:hypothetical protein